MDGHGYGSPVVYRPDAGRVSALARLSHELGTLGSEGELEAAVARAVDVLFAPAPCVTAFFDDGGTLLSVVDGRSLATYLHWPAVHSVEPQRLPEDARAGPRLLAPMTVRGSLFGVLMIERPRGQPEFELADLETLIGIAGQYGLAIYEQRRQLTQRRIELGADLAAAREVQRHFLPTLPPRVGPLRVAVTYRPAHDVGGDFYDVMHDAWGRVVAVIGDVSGCGVAAALIMSRISAELRRVSPMAKGPGQVLAAVNEFAMDTLPDHGFVTAECLVIDPHERTITLANAGHVPALVRRHAGDVEIHGEDSGLPLGFVSGARWTEERFDFAEDDVVLLSTDGLTEGIHLERGLAEVAAILARTSGDLGVIHRALLEAIDASPHAHRDDVAILSLCLSR